MYASKRLRVNERRLYMTIHTPIESPGRVDKKYAVFKIKYGILRP
jgi:hypothetical protein